MKVSFIYILIVACSIAMVQAHDIFGQGLDTKVTIEMKDGKLENLFQFLHRKTGLSFIYNDDEIDNYRDITIRASNQSAKEVLDNALDGKPLSYKINGKAVLVFEISETATAQGAYAPSYAPDIREIYLSPVTGTVKDAATQEPLPAVNIIVKGTVNGTTTDVQGKYTLNVPDEATTLVFSFIGYQTQEVEIRGRETIDIMLSAEAQSLQEVVVIGYGQQKKVNLSGAVDQVGGDFLESRPITNIGSGLQGAMANLNITLANGQATTTPSFNIRGYTSINGGEPLIVVDGIPTDASEFIRMNPADISTITVLKDAASAAIYGARAAFGVVLVTTKTAKEGNVKVAVNSNYAVRTVTRLPEVVTDPYLSAYYKDIMASPWYDLFSDQDLDYIKGISENPDQPRDVIDPKNPELYRLIGFTDWFSEVYKKSVPSYSNSISVSQRQEKVGYFLSGEYFHQDGMFKYNADKFNRYNLRGKVDYQIKPWLKVGNNTSFTYNTYDEPVNNGTSYFHVVNRQPSYGVPYNPDGSYTQGGAELIGPLKDGGRHGFNTNDLLTSFTAEISVVKDIFSIKGDASFRRTNRTDHSFDFPIEYKIGPNRPMTQGLNNYASSSAEATRYNVFNVYGDFHKTIDKHYVSALVGYNQEERVFESFFTRRDKLISNSLPTVNLATGNLTSTAYNYAWAVRGAFYRFNYVFDDKYIFEANGRYDGSSRFPKEDRFAFNPSASLAWVVSEEKFFEPLLPVLDFFKVRASYGSLGNQALTSYYPYIPELLTARTTSIIEGEQPIKVSAPALVSPSFTWEKVSTLNFGVDMAFLDQRLNVAFDAYSRATTGMLTKGKTLPSVLGTGAPTENAADLETKGWETTVGWMDEFNAVGKPFKYNIRVVLADSRSYIEKFDNPTNYLGDYYVGQEIGAIWGLTTEGFFSSNDEVGEHADQTQVASYPGTRPVQAGDVKFKDINNDDVISNGNWTKENPGDYKIIGNTQNRYTFGIDLGAEWNGFDLRVFFQGVGKKDWYPGPATHYFWGVYAQPWANLTYLNLDHWTPERQDAYFPRPKSYTAEVAKELGIPQTKYLQDASYMRMKNLTLGYTFSRSLLGRTGIDRLRIYASGENLLEFSKLMKYLDPENLEGRAYPFQRTISFGLNLNF